MICFPSTAYVGRRMPKEAFYKQLSLAADVRQSFVSDVQRITMEYVLTPESIHVDICDDLKEILILELQMKGTDSDYRIIENIARQNQHKILFHLKYDTKEQLALYQGKLYKTDWRDLADFELRLFGNNLIEIWEGFIEQIALPDEAGPAANLSIDARLKKQESIKRLQKEIDRMERMTRKEQQPKLKFELYQKLQEKKRELEEMVNG